jgi:hypothetical protein
MGFDQAKNIQEYKFDGVAAGETARHFAVEVDLALFVSYHVGLQEGPALCLKKLSADLEALQSLRHELTSGDLTAYASARSTAAEKKTSASGRLPRKFVRGLTHSRIRYSLITGV